MSNQSDVDSLINNFKKKNNLNLSYVIILLVILSVMAASVYYYAINMDHQTGVTATTTKDANNITFNVSSDNPVFDTEVVNTDYITFAFDKPSNYNLKIVDYNAEFTAQNSPILKSFFLTSSDACSGNSNSSTCSQNSFEIRLLKTSSLQIGAGANVDFLKIVRSLSGISNSEDVQIETQEKGTLYTTSNSQYFLVSPDNQYILQFLLANKLQFVGVVGTVVFK